ncbi:hypothetical protein ENUP19_0011G0026 [Entamoeba nuttalli]|uniref:Uncharacterized protein n=1 Tax=Entamoeba nuttalli TaxID=412467 RepID=A0ABQ0D830_9EUKA
MMIQQKESEVLQGKLGHDINQDILYRRYPRISNIISEKTIEGVIIYPETIKFLNQLESIKEKTLEERTSIFANHYNEKYRQVLSLGNSISSRVIDMKKIEKEVVMNLEDMTHTIPTKRVVIRNNPVEVVQGTANESTEKEERKIMNDSKKKDKDINEVIAEIEK